MTAKRILYAVCIVLVSGFTSCQNKNISRKQDTDSAEYAALKNRLAKGWNTWNTHSVLSYVLLPEGFSITLELYDKTTHETLREVLIGRDGNGAEKVKPGFHSYDGSFSELEVEWKNHTIKVQTIAEGKGIGIIITPAEKIQDMELLVKPEIIWGRHGDFLISRSGASVNNGSEILSFRVSDTGNSIDSLIRCPLSNKICITTWGEKKITDIESAIKRAEDRYVKDRGKYRSDSLLYEAMQSVLAWNEIYEPKQGRVIVPVSRLWNCGWGGWVLFDWDTYFSANMLALDNKDLAYANAIAITKEITKNGFIPNYASGNGKTEDRSQPPVGSLVVKEIYKKYRETWLLREVYGPLLSWNRWWEKNRDVDGYLCWGSDVYTADSNNAGLLSNVGEKQAAMWESGLDNSPMYYEAPFDTVTHTLLLADVGLMSLYIADCRNLAEIATVLGKTEDARELVTRGEKYKKKLETLWDDKFGLYLNKDLVTGKFSYRLSPTLFYPLIAKVPSQNQARRMMDEHFFNPSEFWGKWIMPSIARNDGYFERQDYWRGRIWAPMNFLVYLGLRNYQLPDARKAMAEKSAALLLRSWTEKRQVCENYNAILGIGNDRRNSDAFYHWGALLGYISLIEDGYALPPETKLNAE